MAHPDLASDPFPHGASSGKIQDEWFRRRLFDLKLNEVWFLAARAALRFFPLLPKLELKEINYSLYYINYFRIHLCNVSINENNEEKEFILKNKLLKSSVYVKMLPTKTGYEELSISIVDSIIELYVRWPDEKANLAVFRYADIASRASAGVAAFEQDVRDIRRYGAGFVAASPLWPVLEPDISRAFKEQLDSLPRGGMPPAFRPELARFNQWIRAMPDDFAIWAEWYEGVLDGARNGTYLFGLPTEAALRLNVDIALIDEALWNGPPAALHAEMRRLVEAAREKQLSPGTPTAGTPDKEQASSALPSVEEGKKGPSNAKPKPVNPVVKNAHSIALNAHLLLPIIEAELARLDDFRPNSNEEIEKKDAAVAYLKKLRGNLEALRDSAANAQADQASAIKAEQSVGVFRRTFERFMDEKGVELLSDASKASIFVGGVSVLAACGAGVAVPSLVIGAIVAGKPLVEILKAARGMIKVEIKLPGAP